MMTKRSKSDKFLEAEYPNQNPVAKNAVKFNKAQIFRDKKSHYSRKSKHKQLESFKIILASIILKGSNAISVKHEYRQFAC